MKPGGRPGGNPDIVEVGKATRFKSGSGNLTAREAQKKSVQSRNAKRSMRQTMELLARTAFGPGKAYDIGKIKSLQDVSDDKNLTPHDIIALQIVRNAMEGDPECRRLFLELTGAMDEDTASAGLEVEDDELSGSLKELAGELESDT